MFPVDVSWNYLSCKSQVQLWKPALLVPGYLVDTEGGNEKAIQKYVRNQLHEDIASDQMCMREFKDPFTGESVVKGK